MEVDYKRQMEIFDREAFTKPVHIIGCGATGSWLALQLAKLGVQDVTLHDFDYVEAHNIPNQCFPVNTIGRYKAGALLDLCKSMGAPDTWKACFMEVDAATPLEGVVFILTDTMLSRTKIYNACKQNYRVELIIETRMAVDGGRVYTIDAGKKELRKRYESTLYGDDVAEVSACGVTQTIGATASILASYAVWQLIAWAKGSHKYGELLLDVANPLAMFTEWGKEDEQV